MGQRTLKRLVLIVCSWLALSHAPALNAAATPEYLIKAAYLYNFALFVEWPTDAFPTATAPIVIGIVGPDPFDQALDRTIRDKRINKRPLVVRRLQWGQDLTQCHILFVSSSEGSRTHEWAPRLEGLPILIVGDEIPEFARRGATINFIIEDNKVKFEVNVDAARHARLNISAKLLNVARVLRGG